MLISMMGRFEYMHFREPELQVTTQAGDTPPREARKTSGRIA